MSNISSPLVYLLDSNTFIQPAKQYYQFDIAPSYWKALLNHAEQGRIISIDKVKIEIGDENDEIKDWVWHNFGKWFVSVQI